MNDKKKPTENTNSFTIDDNYDAVEEMPSITRLLNRKSLSKKAKPVVPVSTSSEDLPPPSIEEVYDPASETTDSSQTPPPPEVTLETQSAPDSPIELALSLPEPNETVQVKNGGEISIAMEIPIAPQVELREAPPLKNLGVLKIQPSTRKKIFPAQDLIVWEPNRIATGSDPLGQGIYKMLQRGAKSALFMTIIPPQANEPVPHFLSTAAVLGKEKHGIWRGLKWNPAIVPEMWNYFIRAGQVELSPPGNLTNQSSNRNVVRSAFGIQPNEWLLLVRAGPPNACRGVVGFISEQSLLLVVHEAIPMITAPAPQSRTRKSG